MEVDNKYFVPEIEDLFIGYECEKQDYKNRWEESKIRDEDFVSYEFPSKSIRTKYLDEDDLEGLGWEIDYERTEGNTQWIYFYYGESFTGVIPKPESMFNSYPVKHKLQISWINVNNGYINTHIYTIPSKNELLKLMKMLNIC